MTTAPVLKGSELVGLLREHGFVPVRQRGSHVRLRRTDGRAVTVPVHPGRDVSRGLFVRIMHEAAIEP